MSRLQAVDVRVRAAVLAGWPWPVTRSRVRSPFGAGMRGGFWTATETLLRREAAALGTRELVLELDLRDRDLRQDGWIRSDARPASPRVAVALLHPQLSWLRYHCDRYEGGGWLDLAHAGWQANVRAIALSLEALRAVDRHGVTGKGEQYIGFKQLSSSTTTRPAPQTPECAAAILANESDEIDAEILTDPDVARRAYRAAVKRTHPDVLGGNDEAFADVQAARELLDAYHGGP